LHITVRLALVIYLDVDTIEYVSLEGMVDLCWKIVEIGCLALKVPLRIMCSPLNKMFALP